METTQTAKPATTALRPPLEDIYRTCSQDVRRRATNILRNEAAGHDISQQVFLRLFTDLTEGVVIHNPAAYCFRAATNLALNWRRDGLRRHEILMCEHERLAVHGSPPDEHILMRQLLTKCEPEDGAVAAYHYNESLTATEIAAKTGLSRRTVDRRLQRFNDFARNAVER